MVCITHPKDKFFFFQESIHFLLSVSFQLLKGSLTFFEALAEVREVLECLGIVLDENSLTVVDHIASSSVVLVKKEQGSEDMLWEEEPEPADEELAPEVYSE